MTPDLTSRPHAGFREFQLGIALALSHDDAFERDSGKENGDGDCRLPTALADHRTALPFGRDEKPEAVALDRYCPEQRRGYAVRLTISPALVSRTASDFCPSA
jgi:hypothetical protein